LQRGGEANVALAVAKIEELVTRDSRGAGAQPTDRLLLARLYEQQARIARDAAVARERLKRAEEQLTTVAQRLEAEPAHLAALVQFLIRQQRKDDAATWLDRMETRIAAMPKDDPAALALLVQVQLRNGTPRRAEKWLKKLELIDPTPLRALTLRTQVAV